MTVPPVRFFPDDAAIVAVGEGLLATTLPRVAWTHEAHLGATAWLIRDRPDVDLDRDIGTIMRRYNVASGDVNDDTQGYHDTITRTYITGIRVVLKQRASTEPLVDAVNALLSGPCDTRDWPLRFYTRERLLSVEARRAYMAPDLTR
jgi:hypothetical protein